MEKFIPLIDDYLKENDNNSIHISISYTKLMFAYFESWIFVW